MSATVVEITSPVSNFRWIDVSNPTLKDLQALAAKYGLHKTTVRDCLQPEHLPKYETSGPQRFMIVRYYDEAHAPNAADIVDLTRKIAIFSEDQFLITIHRSDTPTIRALRERWKPILATQTENPRAALIVDIIQESIGSFDPPIDQCFERIEKLEQFAFGLSKQKLNLHEVYSLKRQASNFKRLLWLMSDMIKRFALDVESRVNDPGDERIKPLVMDLKEDLENTLFYADDLNESLNQLLNLYLAQESQRTNEIMRVLTVFSAFFMPITFIVGVYGMNFRNMPELDRPWGYPACLFFMLLVSVVIFAWFKRRKWL